MTHRYLAAVLVAVAVVALAPMSAVAQDEAVPRTPWGAPDLQGVWDFRSITPMERPDELADKAFLTAEEAARLEQERIARNEELARRAARRTQATDSVDRGEDGAPGFYNNFWLDYGTSPVETGRTSLIVAPPTGKVPSLTAAAARRRRRRCGKESAGTRPRPVAGWRISAPTGCSCGASPASTPARR